MHSGMNYFTEEGGLTVHTDAQWVTIGWLGIMEQKEKVYRDLYLSKIQWWTELVHLYSLEFAEW